MPVVVNNNTTVILVRGGGGFLSDGGSGSSPGLMAMSRMKGPVVRGFKTRSLLRLVPWQTNLNKRA
jgi:hypothetical protein